MKLAYVTAGLLAAGLTAGAQGATVLQEGFDNVTTLGASGWVITNNSTSPVSDSWFQGNPGVFTAKAGAADAYIGTSFLSSASATGVVDTWLISPQLTLGTGATLTFSTRASDVGFRDLLEVRFSSGGSSDVSSFATVVGVVGDAANPSYPVGAWAEFTLTLPTAATGRFAFHYAVANAMDASYIGIDSVSVSAVPEPMTMALFGLGLASVGAAVRRRTNNAAAAPALY